MKKKTTIIVFCFLLFILSVSLIHLKTKAKKRSNLKTSHKVSKIEYPNDWYAHQRTYPHNQIKLKNYLSALNYAVRFQKNSKELEIEWEFSGPTNIGGRITDIEITQNEPLIIYLGAASGGILKSTDEGATWENIFSQIPTISIGDIAIDPNNEDILYAGTGEANASSYSFFGSGIYKSTDAGENWSPSGLETTAYIGRIIVDYNNSERIFTAACGNLFTKSDERGVYRSVNGGDTWEKILFVSDTTAAMDIVQHYTNPDILYATMWERMRGLNHRQSFGETSGIWKTVDGGDNWTELTNGLPTGTNVGRIGIDIAKSNPSVLYAFYDLSSGSAVYKTTNGGDTWTQTNDGSLQDISNGYGWFFGQIRIDPANENIVYAMGMLMYKTINGGSSWSESGYSMHVDHHAMEFLESTGKVFQGNDGGFYTSTNGDTWTKNNNVPLTQFYDIAIDSLNPHRIYGGTQDNNSIRTSTGNIDDWEVLLGGDGMYTLVDYTNANIFYCEYQWGGLYRFENGYDYYIGFDGERTNWSTPYILHPTNPNILYLGTYQVMKTTNKGDSWTPISNDLTNGSSGSFHTISTLDISKIDPRIILVGTCDGKMHVTTNDGGSWTDISEGLPNRWITRVKTDPFDQNKIYATLSGFRWDEAISNVYMSPDLGETWADISGNLPEIPVNAIILDPDVEDRIIVGTDAGIYLSEDAGEEWYSILNGIPNVPITAMEFHHAIRTLYIGTYGVSSYKAEIPLGEIPVKISPSENNISSEINIFPNPYLPQKQALTININSNISQKAVINIFNINGQKVFSLEQNIKKGHNSLSWNGQNFIGNKVNTGIYLCNIILENQRITKKIIVGGFLL